MLAHAKAILINSKINPAAINSKLVYPRQNLVDLIWTEKPTKSLEMVYIQSTEFAGMDIYLVASALVNQTGFQDAT